MVNDCRELGFIRNCYVSICPFARVPLVLLLNLDLFQSVLTLISPTSCSILTFCFVSMCYFALIQLGQCFQFPIFV